METQYVTVEEAAKYLSASVPSIYRWIAQGKLPAFKLNGHALRINVDQLDYFLTPVAVPA